MTTNWEKIETATNKLNGGKRELARRLGEKPSTVGNWFQRQAIPLEKAPDVVTALDYLISIEDIDPTYFHKISEIAARYETATPRTLPQLNYNEIDQPTAAQGTIPVDGETAKKLSQAAFAIAAQDEAMAPNIKTGDILIIDPRANLNPGDIALAKAHNPTRWVLGSYRVRGYLDNGEPIVVITPENDYFPATEITTEATGQVIGPVIEHRRKLK